MAGEHHPSINHVHGGSMHGHDRLGQHHGDEMTMHEHSSMMEGMHNMEHMHMPTTFSLKTYSDFLFEGVKISNVQGIVLAMIFTIVISILFDSLKFMMHMRESHRANRLKTQVRDRYTCRNLYLGQYVTTAYHVISVTLAYIMMLCAMTMNVWLMISVVVGSGIGHFVMRPVLSRKLKGQLEHTPEYQTDQTKTEERKPLSDHYIVTDNTDSFGESSKNLLPKTNAFYNRESVI